MEPVNCLRCSFRHTDNGNCTAIGGFCTAVPAAHCQLLRQYEDTGLSPESVEALKLSMMGKAVSEVTEFNGLPIDRLRELAEADKEGRIVILPAKTVYELVVDAGPSCDMKCPPAFMDDDGVPCCDFCDKGEIIVNERNCRQDDVRQIGNTVWLTREEAEAALKEVQNGRQKTGNPEQSKGAGMVEWV